MASREILREICEVIGKSEKDSEEIYEGIFRIQGFFLFSSFMNSSIVKQDFHENFPEKCLKERVEDFVKVIHTRLSKGIHAVVLEAIR